MEGLLSGLADDLDGFAVELIYLHAKSSERVDPKRTVTLETLLNYLAEDVLCDPRLVSVIDGGMRRRIPELQGALDKA